MNLKTFIYAGVSALAASLPQASPAFANYSFSTYAEPTNNLAKGVESWAEAVEERTDGEVAFDIYYGGALIPPRDALSGIGQGVANAGQHISTYSPSQNPLWASLSDVAFKQPDPLVVTFAATEYGLFDPEGRGEWIDNNVISLSAFSTTPYVFLCRDRGISTLEDLQGKRIRTAGGPWARFANSIGAIDVNLPSSEIYTALERGAADCANADASHVISGSTLKDIIGTVLLQDVGVFFPGSALLVNIDTWNSLSPEARQIMVEEAAVAMIDREVNGYIKLAADGIETAREMGIDVNQPGEDLAAAYDDFLAALDQDVIAAGEQAGVDNIEQEIADFTALLDKWDALLADVDRNDPQALLDLVNAEIFDKIDVETIATR